MPDLPSEPSLEQLRHQARDLQRAIRRGDRDALAEVAERHPAGRPDDAAAAGFSLSAAQLVVARRYDFPSWARLRRYVEVVERYSRFPERMAVASPADEFLRLACLYSDDDQPGRWAQAKQMVRGQLHWAITHGMTERVRLLVEHGVDIVSPFDDGITSAERAAITGHSGLVPYLVAHGAPALDLRPAQGLAAAALAADEATVTGLLAARPGLADAVREARPALIVWAAAHGQPGSVELLAGLGFDVNAKDRSDVLAEDPWQTALHVAAMEGQLSLARSLLRLGADPDIRDYHCGSTPLGWARYFGQDQLIELLEPLTAPDEPDADAGEPAS